MFARLQKTLEGAVLPPQEEAKALELLLGTDAAAAVPLCKLLLNQRRTLRAELAGRDALIEKLRQPPWYPGTVLRALADGRVDLVSGGRRQIAATTPEVDAGALAPGDEVFLNAESLVVGRGDGGGRSGLVGTVAERVDGHVLVQGPGEEQLYAPYSPHLAHMLRAGDRVVYQRDVPWVFERLPERTQSRWLLERPPAVGFDEIGGLEDVKAEIRRDLDLHLLHRERVRRYGLRLLRGILLAGSPGVGKTLIAKAIAHHLGRNHPETRFVHVPPGAVRGMYYGESEARVREIFAVARSHPGLVVMFFDEVDSFGTRGAALGQDVDGRVLATLLAELDGLGSAENVFCIGATNRLDLCDPALVRAGRLGDRRYQVPRPDRDATRAILALHFGPELPYAQGPDGERAAATLVAAAVGHLHAPAGDAGSVAAVTLQNGTRHEVRPAAVLSGALLASAAQRAKHAAAHRQLEGGVEGIAIEDLLGALDDALAAEARQLAAPHVARRVLDAPWASEIALVEIPEHRRLRRHQSLRAA